MEVAPPSLIRAIHQLQRLISVYQALRNLRIAFTQIIPATIESILKSAFGGATREGAKA